MGLSRLSRYYPKAISRESRNRVSELNLDVDTKIIVETRFLVSSHRPPIAWSQEKPGF
ncbi:MAG: hypothetical protein GDA48_01495 [Hormoscilla sp. GM102CHS1]|nr:hypothetical protein [Hormoscilla sp. GM102CHS1]